jgi:hypothetical protein
MSITDWLLLTVAVLLLLAFPDRIALVLLTLCAIMFWLINFIVIGVFGNRRRP